MLIKCLPVGHMEANCYVVTDEMSLMCAVVDPGDESNTILDYVEDNKLKVCAIFLTHGHFDHTGAAETVSQETGAPIYINAGDVRGEGKRDLYKYAAPENVKLWSDGDVITVGALNFRVLETPGHSPGSVCLRCQDVLFTGDTLFRGSCGRTDLSGGDMDTLMASLKRLGDIPGDLEVYPGHMEATTLSVERATNYYMRYARGI